LAAGRVAGASAAHDRPFTATISAAGISARSALGRIDDIIMRHAFGKRRSIPKHHYANVTATPGSTNSSVMAMHAASLPSQAAAPRDTPAIAGDNFRRAPAGGFGVLCIGLEIDDRRRLRLAMAVAPAPPV